MAGTGSGAYASWVSGVMTDASLPRDLRAFLLGLFGPLEPIRPMPIDVGEDGGRPMPRRFEYPVGWNMPVGQPGTEGLKLLSFQALRRYADAYCLAPTTRVLCADLEWRLIGDVQIGDELIGFDEYPTGRSDKYGRRKFRKARVEACGRITRPSYRVRFTDGREIVASREHLWLSGSRRGKRQGRKLQCGGDYAWIATADLRPGTELKDFGQPWERDASWGAGYLAGVFDGEASLHSAASRGWGMAFAQKPGVVLDTTERLLRERGHVVTRTALKENGVANLNVRGGAYETLRFIGECGTVRFTPKIPDWLEGRQCFNRIGPKYATVESVEFIGEQEVVAIGTSTKTLIAEGIFSHNSVARTAIRVRKQEILGIDFEIVPTDEKAKELQLHPGERTEFETRRRAVAKFFEKPDSNYHNFQNWLNALLEDLFVVDAMTLYLRPPRAKRSGVLHSDLVEIEVLNGQSIRPLLDLRGGTPRPPNPAYQQYVHGVPRLDLMDVLTEIDLEDLGEPDASYMGDQLLYLPYETRSWTPYGFPAMEQCVLPTSIGLNIQTHVNSFYTEGTVPDTFVMAPPELTTVEQQRQLQEVLNAVSGDIGYKSKIVVLPPNSRPFPMKPASTASEALARLNHEEVLMAFDVQPMEVGLSPKSGLGGKGFAEGSENVQERRATKPLLRWLKGAIFDFVIREVFKQEDMEARWVGWEQAEDDEKKANVDKANISIGRMSIDETRLRDGLQPWGMPETTNPVIVTAQGLKILGAEEEEPPPPGEGGPPGGGPEGPEKPDGGGDGGTPLHSAQEESADEPAAAPSAMKVLWKYSPDQSRDAGGRFGEGGGGVSGRGEPERSMIARLRDGGGFTYKVSQAKFHEIGQRGFMVSPYPDREKVIEGRVTRADFRAFREANADVLSKAGHAMGAWKDPSTGKTYLDVSILTRGRADAIGLAREHGQYAIFDLRRGEEIRVEGRKSVYALGFGRDRGGGGGGAADPEWGRRAGGAADLLKTEVAWEQLRATSANKAAGQPEAAGVCVIAADTGRVLMLQRANDPDDPAAGTWEFPGGVLEEGEHPWDGARREWQEEVGIALPLGKVTGEWESPNGVYRGFVYQVAAEADVRINADHEDRDHLNPDDPDGDGIEVVAWWDPTNIPRNRAVRVEVRRGTDFSLLAVEGDGFDEARRALAPLGATVDEGGRLVVRKDFTTASPLGSGLVPFDLGPARRRELDDDGDGRPELRKASVAAGERKRKRHDAMVAPIVGGVTERLVSLSSEYLSRDGKVSAPGFVDQATAILLDGYDTAYQTGAHYGWDEYEFDERDARRVAERADRQRGFLVGLASSLLAGHAAQVAAGGASEHAERLPEARIGLYGATVYAAFEHGYVTAVEADPEREAVFTWRTMQDGDVCFPAGERVALPRGEKPIEAILPGEYVRTPRGPRAVRAVSERQYRGRLVHVRMADGRAFAATANHPVWVNGAWLRADAIRAGDLLQMVENQEVEVLGVADLGFSDAECSPTEHTEFSIPPRVSCSCGAVPILAVDFKGDVDIGEGEVDGVARAGQLQFGNEEQMEALQCQANEPFEAILSVEFAIAGEAAKGPLGSRRRGAEVLTAGTTGDDERWPSANFGAVSSLATASLAHEGFPAPLAHENRCFDAAGVGADRIAVASGLRDGEVLVADRAMLGDGPVVERDDATGLRTEPLGPAGVNGLEARAALSASENSAFSSRADRSAARADVPSSDLVDEERSAFSTGAIERDLTARFTDLALPIRRGEGPLAADAEFIGHGVIVESIPTITVYNLEIEEEHCYYVGGVLVHNCGLCEPRDGEEYTADTLPGFPGEGGFGDLCEGGPNCRCELEEVGTEGPVYTAGAEMP